MTQIPNDGAVSRGDAYPMAAGAMLLGIYVAMHLAVAGVLHLVSGPDAAAAVVRGSTAHETIDQTDNSTISSRVQP